MWIKGEWHEEEDESNWPTYWRIYLPTSLNKLVVVCMQDFDECDYRQENFVCENEVKLKFDTEEEAIKYLNDNFKSEFIDDEFLFVETRIEQMRK